MRSWIDTPNQMEFEFARELIVDNFAGGRPLPKSAKVRMCGNSVSPVMSRVLVQANLGIERRRAAA